VGHQRGSAAGLLYLCLARIESPSPTIPTPLIVGTNDRRPQRAAPSASSSLRWRLLRSGEVLAEGQRFSVEALAGAGNRHRPRRLLNLAGFFAPVRSRFRPSEYLERRSASKASPAR
jgi:hypothetical protein